MSKVPKVKLSDGNQIPILGLGTWKASPGEVYTAVCHAIDVGYRHFDCALAYQNEHEVGKAIRDKIAEGKIKREDVFVTSKCWNTYHPRELVVESFNKTMSDLDIGYLDLYLMHWPFSYQHGGDVFPRDEAGKMITTVIDFMETWQGIEELHKAGKVKSIGVSNFNSEQLTRIIKEGSIPPVMNQVECHPYLNQGKLLNFCKQHGIALTAYCPLGSKDRPWASADEPALLEHPDLIAIGAKYGKTSAHVLIRFQIERGVVVIPKSANASRIEANLKVFDFKLSPEDMKTIEAFNNGYRFVGLSDMKDHPYFPFGIEF